MNPGMLRICDANANRAREALRVLEDYARFVLNDESLSAGLKQIRHDLRGALELVLADAILFRDAAADVGKTIKTPAEFDRKDLADILTAAGKRLGEALRTLEEYCKTIAPPAATAVEALRYRSYDIEQRLARTLRPDLNFDSVRLYVLITESSCAGRAWYQTAQAALAGGAQALQLREKQLDGGELLSRAKQLVALCRAHGALSIINDRVDIALAADADGVHVGQGDLPATEVRKLIGRGKVIGVSTHTIEQARQAVLDGADYIGVGPVFPSATKPRNFLPGLDYARQIADAHLPIAAVAIAGITLDNIDQLLATGLNRIAVTAACSAAPDVEGAARMLLEKINDHAAAGFSPPVPIPEDLRAEARG